MTRCSSSLLLGLLLAVFAAHAAARFQCFSGSQIPHSNRDETNPCVGYEGDECTYTCQQGFLKIGRHVCQSYSTNGVLAINQSFHGGRCQELCASSPSQCAPPLYALRMSRNISMAESCYQTQCLTKEAIFLKLVKGGMQLFNLARQPSGLYLDHVDIIANTSSTQAAIGVTGLGLVAKVVADALQLETRSSVQDDIIATLSALNSSSESFTVSRNAQGWMPTFVNSVTGASLQPTNTTPFSSLATGLNTAGVLFARSYYADVDPGSARTAKIVRLASSLVDRVSWEDLLCDRNQRVNRNGTGLPMVFDDKGGCSAVEYPEDDGFYSFFEIHYTVSVAYHHICSGHQRGLCPNKAIELLWDRYQGRCKHPNHQFLSYPLLTMWSAYVVQLPYYTVHAFNSNTSFEELFVSHWQADRSYYNSTAEQAGSDGMYGLGAGPSDQWCSGSGYLADRIETQEGGANCRMYSPYSVAGYRPADVSVVDDHLLALVAAGDVVYPMPDSDDVILWRRSMLDHTWVQGYGVTMVDYAAELFGLSTLWLNKSFFQNYSNHWPEKQ